jgi:hypothetical protein
MIHNRKGTVVPFSVRPRTFTSSEVVIDYLAEKIITDKRTYRQIAEDCGVGVTTIANIATRQTKWPRPTTFFAVLAHYNIKLELK